MSDYKVTIEVMGDATQVVRAVLDIADKLRAAEDSGLAFKAGKGKRFVPGVNRAALEVEAL